LPHNWRNETVLRLTTTNQESAPEPSQVRRPGRRTTRTRRIGWPSPPAWACRPCLHRQRRGSRQGPRARQPPAWAAHLPQQRRPCLPATSLPGRPQRLADGPQLADRLLLGGDEAWATVKNTRRAPAGSGKIDSKTGQRRQRPPATAEGWFGGLAGPPLLNKATAPRDGKDFHW
jgi:hypothetical protein